MIPYGYEIKNGDIVVNEKAAEIIRWMYAQYIKGDSPYTITLGLALHYNENIGLGRVRNILKNNKYLGDENFTPILDENTYQQAQQQKEKIRPKLTNPTGEKGVYPLSSKILCGFCGKGFLFTMVAPHATKKWACYGKNNVGIEKCRHRILESEILQAFQRILIGVKQNNKLLTTKPDFYKAKPTPQYNMLNYKINKAFKDEEFVAKELISQLFERAQEEYKSATVDYFEQQTTTILQAIQTYNGTEENTNWLINKILEQVIIHEEKITFSFKNKVVIDIKRDRG